GSNGTSLRMIGLDTTNSNVFDRAIVIHAAEYCTQAQIDRWGRLGRSNGCFAMSPTDLPVALSQLSGGRLLYAD
ncbi:murein L,D-transpeptidase catalytic domain-containing protein, partial [Jeotgalibacillus marinus]